MSGFSSALLQKSLRDTDCVTLPARPGLLWLSQPLYVLTSQYLAGCPGIFCLFTGYFSLDYDLPECRTQGLLCSGVQGLDHLGCHVLAITPVSGQGFLL